MTTACKANGFNGVTALVYRGDDFHTKTQPLGQGELSMTIAGEGIVMSNKSSGEWQEMLCDPDGNNTTERSVQASVSYDMMPDSEQKLERLAGLKRAIEPRIFVFGDLYVKGMFQISVNTLAGGKGAKVTMEFSYNSSGKISFFDKDTHEEIF